MSKLVLLNSVTTKEGYEIALTFHFANQYQDINTTTFFSKKKSGQIF